MIVEYNIKDIKKTAETIAEYLRNNPANKIIAFNGKMGSGKTTLIKEICDLFKVTDDVTSPTFAIINEYNSLTYDFIYHFDFYRLENIQEALDIGTEDYFYSGFYCFIEWPEIVNKIIPEETISINIEIIDNDTRKIEIKKNI